MSTTSFPKSQEEWRTALAELPTIKGEGSKKLPAFFFAHGSPTVVWPKSTPPPAGPLGDLVKLQGPESPLAEFLKDFGTTLLEKYSPKAIVVFSAHWETSKETLVTDYGDENPLLYDYYGFGPEWYDLKFSSRGDSTIARRVVELLQEAGIPSRLTTASEPRGKDGRGFNGPGLDHGVFIPFKVMWGDKAPLPVIEVSIDESMHPEKEWALGKAVDRLRAENVLVLSGGLTIHTFQNWAAWSEKTASQDILAFDQAILDACSQPPETRKAAMVELTQHPGFRVAHPREDHFVPIYVAAGAGEDEESKILNANHGIVTVAFGV